MASKIVPPTKQDPVERNLDLAHEFSDGLGIKPRIFTRYTGQHDHRQSKYVQLRFDDKLVRKWGFVDFHQLTDVQFGHVCCREEKLREFVEHILAAENRFVLLTGDNVDAAHVGSPGGPYENKGKPVSQVELFCQVIAPMAHRLAGSVSGNHEQRPMLYFGDLGTLLAIYLKVPFSSGQQTVDVHFGQHRPFRFELWHGRGAARAAGAKLNMLERHMKDNPEADCVLVGHLHDAITHRRWIKKPDAANMTVRLREQMGAMSSSFLEFWGNYGEVMGLSPTGLAMARIRLHADGRSELTL